MKRGAGGDAAGAGLGAGPLWVGYQTQSERAPCKQGTWVAPLGPGSGGLPGPRRPQVSKAVGVGGGTAETERKPKANYFRDYSSRALAR